MSWLPFHYGDVKAITMYGNNMINVTKQTTKENNDHDMMSHTNENMNGVWGQ